MPFTYSHDGTERADGYGQSGSARAPFRRPDDASLGSTMPPWCGKYQFAHKEMMALSCHSFHEDVNYLETAEYQDIRPHEGQRCHEDIEEYDEQQLNEGGEECA
ncbi:hypothetical protein ACLOJK_022810 [Asimina triloba]